MRSLSLHLLNERLIDVIVVIEHPKPENNMKPYVVYTRVSTQKQAASRLGIEAQEASVAQWIKSNPGSEVIATFTEIESGKRDNRPELIQAINLCRKENATLLIAKLDRLSRNASFIFQVRDAGIQIQAVDLPELSTLTLGIFASLAQFERETIASRTKVALQAKKERGFNLGMPQNLSDNKQIAEANSAATRREQALSNKNNRLAARRIKELREMDKTWAEIARELTRSEYRTSSDKSNWSSIQVQRLYKLMNR